MILFKRKINTRVLLFGGLGNQLFQISMGFAVVGESELVLDASLVNPVKNPNWFNSFHDFQKIEKVIFDRNSTLGFMRLRMINLAIRISAQNFECTRFKKIQKMLIHFYSLTLQLIVFKGQRVFISRGIGAQDIDLNKLHGYVLIGYFQTYEFVHSKCPNNVIEKIRTLLGVSESNTQDARSVAIQIRLGDYEKNSQIGMLDMSYFRKALSVVENDFKIESAVVFSDEIQKALSYLDDNTVLDLRNGETETNNAVSSLVAMSNYCYFIISNSTFAWWAASLSINTKKVIAPYPWFSGPNSPTKIIPPSWNTVSRDG